MSWASVQSVIGLAENHSSYHTFFEGHNLCTTADSATVRNIFTTAYVILNFLITLIGAMCLKKRNQHHLLSTKTICGRHTVPINHFASWFSIQDSVIYFWKTLSLPGGFYGVVMLFTALMYLAHQFVVNSSIVTFPVPTRCNFTVGAAPILNVNVAPAADFACTNTLFTAQTNAHENEAFMGVYKMVPQISTGFSPYLDYAYQDSNDVLGFWNCTILQASTIKSTDWANNQSFYDYLATNDMSTYLGVAYGTNGNIEAFISWQNGTWDPSHYEVLASVATSLDEDQFSANVTNLNCQLVVADQGWVPPLSSFDAGTWEAWAIRTFGVLMDYQNDVDYAYYVAWTLNIMTMAAGAGNDDTTAVSDLSGSDRTYGCLVPGTEIYLPIWILLGVLLLVLSFVLYGYIHYGIIYWLNRKNANHLLIEHVPGDLLEWQMAMLRAEVNDQSIKSRQMKHYTTTIAGGSWAFVKRDTHAVPKSESMSEKIIHEEAQIETISEVEEETHTSESTHLVTEHGSNKIGTISVNGVAP